MEIITLLGSALIVAVLLVIAWRRRVTACPECTPGLHGEAAEDCRVCGGAGVVATERNAMVEPKQMIPRVEWNRLWVDVGASGNMTAAFDELVAAYGLGRRSHHTLAHVMTILGRIDEIVTGSPIPMTRAELNATRWAAWFHDAVMFVSANDVADSAFMGAEVARKAGLPQSFIDKAHRLILATGHDRRKLYEDESVLVDADLSILGADRERFDEYERLVRLEWPDVSDADFAEARARILRGFLGRALVYSTPYARDRWEERARENLAYSIAKLTVAS